jgi:hypothetical protein
VRWGKLNQFVAQALMILLALIMGDKRRDGPAKVPFAERNQAIETFLLDRADEAFSVRIAVRRAIRRLDGQRSKVSGVTIVATLRSTCRPSRYARAASCRRSSSVRRKRRPPSCRCSTRFSSIRYASISRSWRSSQLVRVRSNMRRAETSITDRSLQHCRHSGVDD